MAYARRYVGGFVDKPTLATPIDSTFLNAVEAALLKLYALDPTDGQIMAWVAANSRFEPTLIKNANIDPAAAIAKSKLGALAITDADIAGGAAIAQSKLALALQQPTNFAAGSKITTSALAGGPPGSPADGDIWIATGVDGNGTRWQFQYNAGSASTYKWEFIGGPPLLARSNPNSAHTSAGWTRSAYLLVPRAGDYVGKVMAVGSVSAAGLAGIICVPDNNNGGVINGILASFLTGQGAAANVSLVNELRWNGVTSDIDLFAYASGCTFTLNNAFINILPVRV